MREPENCNRPSVVRVMAEYMSSGIWAAEPDGWFRHGMLTHDSLGLPTTLAARFDAWIDEYLESDGPPQSFDWVAFDAEGRSLAHELKRFLGPDVAVVYASVANIREDELIDGNAS